MSNYGNEKDKMDYKEKFIKQSIICVIIFAVIFIISLLNTKTASLVTDRVESSLSYTVDYKTAVTEIVDRIKNVVKGENEWKKDVLK